MFTLLHSYLLYLLDLLKDKIRTTISYYIVHSLLNWLVVQLLKFLNFTLEFSLVITYIPV